MNIKLEILCKDMIKYTQRRRDDEQVSNDANSNETWIGEEEKGKKKGLGELVVVIEKQKTPDGSTPTHTHTHGDINTGQPKT